MDIKIEVGQTLIREKDNSLWRVWKVDEPKEEIVNKRGFVLQWASKRTYHIEPLSNVEYDSYRSNYYRGELLREFRLPFGARERILYERK